MQIALMAPEVFGGDLSPDDILSQTRALGVHAIELSASTVEATLGKPTVPAWWIEMPDNGFETGALPLEEEILQDEVELARATYTTGVREWRASVSLAPLESLRRAYDAAGVSIAILHWNDLSRFGDMEVDYGFNVARGLGAGALSTRLIGGAPRRLAPFADRHAMRIGFRGDVATRSIDIEAALTHSPLNAVSLDLRRWMLGGHGPPLPFLRQHADRVIQARIDATDVESESIREVLHEIRANQWPLQVAIGLENATLRGADRMTAIARALDYCLNGLRLST